MPAPGATAGGWTRPPTAQEFALDYLLHSIRTGRLAAGEQVSAEVVAGQIDVSHVPVREAIRRLEGRGVLTHVPRKGHFVTELNVADLDSLVVLGRLLETEALHSAVPAITDGQITRMQATIDQSRAVVGVDAFAVAAQAGAFHSILLEKGVPRLLLRQLDLLWSGMEAYRHFYYALSVYQTATCDEHGAILQALQHRDVDATIEAFNSHRISINTAMKQLPPFSEAESDV